METCRLEKYQIWWLWRGYLPLTSEYGENACMHPLTKDADGFFTWRYLAGDRNLPQSTWLDDPSAFPALKPDADLYGVPVRSRTQSGWYHVHRPPCTFCTATGLPPDSEPKPASDSAVSRLPAEIIHAIIQNEALRRTQAALVCKHWARVCLREEWSALLRGRARFVELQSLINAPDSYLKHSIASFRRISYPLNKEDDPWIHLLPVAQQLLPRFTSASDCVKINGPLGKGITTMRSIHVYLPCQLPPSFSNNIQELILSNIHFRTLGDVVRTVREIPCLEEFRGQGLTWTSGEPRHAPLRRRGPHRASTFLSPRVTLSRCTCNLDAMLAVVSGYNCTYTRAVLDSLIFKNASIRVSAQAKHEHYRSSFGRGPLVNVLFCMSIGCDDCELRVLQTWQADSLSPRNVKLNMCLQKPPTSLASVDWGAYDKAIAEHPQARSIVMGRYETTWFSCAADEWVPVREDESRFIKTMLPLSLENGKLSFDKPTPLAEWEVQEKREDMTKLTEDD